jgi:hypothetical protein
MKGQAALEFMMTYGWAILVVLAAIGALSYFGVLDPSRFTPNTCMASSGFSCDGKPVGATDNVIFTLSNGVGFDVPLNNNAANLTLGVGLSQHGCTIANVNMCPRGTTNCVTPSTILADGASVTVNVSGCDFSKINIIKGDLTFSYYNIKSGLPEELKVTLVAKPK